MTTATQTAKMIYPSQAVANMICGKLMKRDPGKSYHVVPVTSGFQVAPVTLCPPKTFTEGLSYSQWATAATQNPQPTKKFVPVKNNKTFANAQSTTLDALTFELPYLKETKAWVYFAEGSLIPWVHKGKLISSELIETPNEPVMFRFKISAKEAAKIKLPVE